jgi:hypothetical protein
MLEGLTLFLGIASIYLIIKINQVNKINAVLGQTILDDLTTKTIEKESNEEYLVQENFLKFVSDSREWAFDYIENTQEHLRLFIDDLKKDVLFFESFGILTDKYPNYEAMVKFVDHYRKLEKLLPEQDKND